MLLPAEPFLYRSKHCQKSLYAFSKFRHRCEQADDDKSVGSKIVKMAGMHQHVMLAEESGREFFVGSAGRCADDSGPAGVCVQELAGGLLSSEVFECGAIFADALQDLRLNRMALLE